MKTITVIVRVQKRCHRRAKLANHQVLVVVVVPIHRFDLVIPMVSAAYPNAAEIQIVKEVVPGTIFKLN